MAGKPIPAEDKKRLENLGWTARELRYSSNVTLAEKVRRERDSLIHRLAWDGVNPTALAEAASVHRTMVYRIKDDERLQ